MTDSLIFALILERLDELLVEQREAMAILVSISRDIDAMIGRNL